MRVYYQKKDIHKGCKAEVKKINPHVYEIEDNNCFVICLFNYTVYELIIPPANFVCRGYTVFTLSVRPSIRPSVCPCVRP